MQLSTINKAIAGGLTAALVGVATRYGFHPTSEAVTATGVILTAVVSYAAGHLLVFLAPSNKPKV